MLIDDTEDADAGRPPVKKEKAKITDAQMKKAVEYIANGGEVSAIESKYTLTAQQKKILRHNVNIKEND